VRGPGRPRRPQLHRNPGDDVRRGLKLLGYGRGVGTRGRDIAAHLVQGTQESLGLRVCADLSAQPSGGFFVQQTGLQVGEEING
jgi:hypothetical protein